MVDAGQKSHQLAHVDRLLEAHLVHRQGHHIMARVATGAGVGDLVELLEDGATVYLATEIGHVGGHQYGHAQFVLTR